MLNRNHELSGHLDVAGYASICDVCCTASTFLSWLYWRLAVATGFHLVVGYTQVLGRRRDLASFLPENEETSAGHKRKFGDTHQNNFPIGRFLL